jgi:hypothetical protein
VKIEALDSLNNLLSEDLSNTNFSIFAVGTEERDISITPSSFSLSKNYPNPFTNVTHIHYALPVASKVVVRVYNILGAQVAQLVSEHKEPGCYVTKWNGTSQNGKKVANGIYFYSLQTKDYWAAEKMYFMKL